VLGKMLEIAWRQLEDGLNETEEVMK